MVPLTPREMEVCRGIAEGRTNREIAHHLGTEFQTVKNHVASILHKLDVPSRTDVAVWYVERVGRQAAAAALRPRVGIAPTPHGGETARRSPYGTDLTRREMQALCETILHGGRKEAAVCLGIAEQTVANLLANVYSRLGVTSLLQAAWAVGMVVMPVGIGHKGSTFIDKVTAG